MAQIKRVKCFWYNYKIHFTSEFGQLLQHERDKTGALPCHFTRPSVHIVTLILFQLRLMTRVKLFDCKSHLLREGCDFFSNYRVNRVQRFLHIPNPPFPTSLPRRDTTFPRRGPIDGPVGAVCQQLYAYRSRILQRIHFAVTASRATFYTPLRMHL